MVRFLLAGLVGAAGVTRARSLSVALLTLVSISVQAVPTWHFGTYGGTANRIWYGDDEAVNWVFQTTVANTTNLTITTFVQGSGDLDLTGFAADMNDGVNDGKRIVSLSGTFSGKTIVGRVYLPESVVSIGQNTFYNCTSLVSIEATGVKEISAAAFNGATGLSGTVSFPSVRKLFGSCFFNCSSVEEFQFASVTNILDRAFSGCSSVKSIVLSDDLQELSWYCFTSCKALESITPQKFPALVKIGDLFNDTPPPNFVLYLDAPELVSLGSNGFRCETIGFLHAPKLQTIGGNAFREVKFNDGTCDLDFPDLETLGTDALRNSTMTSIRAPKLKALPSNAFYGCSALTNVVLSQECTSFGGSSVSSCPLLASFSPMFPTDAEVPVSVFGQKSYGSAQKLSAGSRWPQPFVWDNANVPVIGTQLCYYFPLTNVTFLTEVTSIGDDAFYSLAPQADIHFYGAAPTFGTRCLYRVNAEKNDERPIIHIHTASTLSSWQAAAAPNAERFATYREKPDCPAEAIGLITIPNGTSPLYAYLVNDAAVAGTGYLAVEGNPLPLGAVDPEYGTRSEVSIGAKFPCTAPSVVAETDVRAGLAGYVVSNVTASGEITFRAEGDTDSYAYEQLEDSARLTWVWTNVRYRVTADVRGPGSVSAAEQWIEYTKNATVTAIPQDGYAFRFWEGADVPVEQRYHPTLTLVADGPKAVTAVFSEPVTYVWSYDSASNPKTISYGSSDGEDTRWVFKVTETDGRLSISEYVSGEGDLDFSSFAVPGKEIVSIGVNVLQRRESILYGFLNTGTIRDIPSMALGGLSNLKELFLPCVTNLGRVAVQGATSLTNIVLSADLASVGDGVFSGSSSLQSISPAYMPALKRIASYWMGYSPATLTYALEAPELEEVGNSAFKGSDQSKSMKFSRLVAPKLKRIGGGAFQSVRFAAGAGDLSFPELTSLDASAFQGSQLSSIRAPKVTLLTNNTFNACSSLTNVVFSDCLKRIYDNVFVNNGATKLTFEPFMPTDMEYVSPLAFAGSRSDYAQDFANTEFVWDNPLIPEVPPYLVPDAPLAHVVFKSDVTLVQTNAFQSLTSRAVVEFHGPSVPELVKLPFYYNGEKNDDRVRILVCNKEALAGWRAKVAVNDELYRTSFKRQKPDWPGRRTLGILELSGTLLNGRDPVAVSYAWVVDGTPGPGLSIIVR